jgi:polysaccharide export outer membrane protein
MIQQLRKNAGLWVVALGMILAGLLGGCQTGQPTYSTLPTETVGNTFHVGDTVTVTAIPPSGDPNGVFPPVPQRISEDGTITLPLIGSVTAKDRTAGELQKAIHDAYVPKYHPELNVSVKGEPTYYFVDGDVNQPGQKEYSGQMTVVKAITAAGGFTDFARKSKVRLTRGSHTEVINVDKAISDPKYDVPVLPGDKIHVPRRPF